MSKRTIKAVHPTRGPYPKSLITDDLSLEESHRGLEQHKVKKLSIFTLLLDQTTEQTSASAHAAEFCSSVTSDVKLEGKVHQRPSEECTRGGLFVQVFPGSKQTM